MLSGWLWAAGVAAEPQRVRLPEGNVHGFLIVRTLAGEVIAYGELVQKLTRGLLTSRLLLHFMELTPEGEEKVLLGKDAKTVVRYRVKLELGGLTGLIAPVLGKQPQTCTTGWSWETCQPSCGSRVPCSCMARSLPLAAVHRWITAPSRCSALLA